MIPLSSNEPNARGPSIMCLVHRVARGTNGQRVLVCLQGGASRLMYGHTMQGCITYLPLKELCWRLQPGSRPPRGFLGASSVSRELKLVGHSHHERRLVYPERETVALTSGWW